MFFTGLQEQASFGNLAAFDADVADVVAFAEVENIDRVVPGIPYDAATRSRVDHEAAFRAGNRLPCRDVKIDGIDLREWKLDSLRAQISIIEQDIFLFSKSVAENIAFGKPQASHAEIESAAKKAQADGFIESLPEGYNTVIGERGATISGGQRQRLALARAFLTDPKILILDDSTSAIDSKTEDEIQQAIKLASEGRTTFIITHRLSQIRWADLIIVMRKGRISAIGTHEQLMQTSRSYRNIFAEAKE